MWSALNYVFDVVDRDPLIRSHLDSIFEGLSCGGHEAAGESLALSDDATMSAPGRINDLLSRVNLEAIASAEGNLLFHAGAVGDHAGRSVIVCGPSGSGKSTLTVRLVEQGATYLTDETACLDPTSLVLQPYRKPVSLKAGSQGVLRHLQPRSVATQDTWLIPPSAIDRSSPPARRWLPTLVVFPTYALGAGLQVHQVAPAEAAFLLGRNSSRLSCVRGGGLPALARVARRAKAYKIVHDDLDAAAGAVQDLWGA